MGKKQKIIPYSKFHRLTVLKEVERYRSHKNIPMRQVLCRCACGKEKVFIYSEIKRGVVKSCGCYGKSLIGERRRTHGKSSMPIYKVWAAMKDRCLNKNNKSYKNYGGRGIKVCDSWLNFENFYKDFGHKHRQGLSINRIDNDGNYEIDNCRWIKPALQASNTRKNVIITYKNKTMIVSDWERYFGFTKDYIASYLRKGLTFEQIINRKKYERTKIKTT